MRIREFPDKTRYETLCASANVVPVCVEMLADTETPVSILQKLYCPEDSVFLLESVEGGERWGRYSFLGVSAKSRVCLYRDHVEIKDEKQTRRLAHHGRPLEVLRHYMAGFTPAHVPELPRFWGGLVGHFTYETVSFFEKIPNRLPEDAPMGVFVVPRELLIFDNVKNSLMGVRITFLENGHTKADVEKQFQQARDALETLMNKVLSPAGARAKNNTRCGCGTLSQVLPPEVFRKYVETTKEHIRAGDIIQAVISQPFECASPPDPVTLYRAQRYINPSPYLFFMHTPDSTLVGSSPETMVRLENRVATLRPIAGTRPRGNSEQEDRALADDLLKDEKERAEHLMLVDLGRNDLGRVAQTGSVQVTDLMVVERYSHVMHLVSNIRCDLLPNTDAWDLLAASFPAGTLSGAPKIRAMEIIDSLEQSPRGAYGGALGYVSFNGNMDMAIIIRTAQLADGKLTLRAGAGIVADSDPEKERMETMNKARAIERALHLANGGAC